MNRLQKRAWLLFGLSAVFAAWALVSALSHDIGTAIVCIVFGTGVLIDACRNYVRYVLVREE